MFRTRQDAAEEPVHHCIYCLENQPAVNVRQNQARSARCCPGRNFSIALKKTDGKGGGEGILK
jgi:hypothetical protein